MRDNVIITWAGANPSGHCHGGRPQPTLFQPTCELPAAVVRGPQLRHFVSATRREEGACRKDHGSPLPERPPLGALCFRLSPPRRGVLDVTATSVCDANAAHRLASWFFTNRGKLGLNSMEWANLPFWFWGHKHSFGTSARWEPTASAAVPSGFPRRFYWVPEVGGVPTVPPTEPAVCAVQPAAVRAKAAASTATTTFTAGIPLPDLRAFIGYPLRSLISPVSDFASLSGC